MLDFKTPCYFFYTNFLAIDITTDLLQNVLSKWKFQQNQHYVCDSCSSLF